MSAVRRFEIMTFEPKRIDASCLVLVGRNERDEMRYVMWIKELWRTAFEEQVTIAKNVAQTLGNKLKAIYLDSTGMGEPVYEMLAYQNVGGKPLGGLVYAVNFSNERKAQMMTNLITLLEQGKLKISPEYKRLLNQMKMQQYKVTASRIIYSHPEGEKDTEYITYHDDILWALNLALWGDFNTPIFKRGGVRFADVGEEKKAGILQRIREVLGVV
jgi:hypothetical protein